MSTTTTTLTEFLTARLDEDEAKAKRIREGTDGGVINVELMFREKHRRIYEQVDTYDPAHVLADVDAKRRIMKRISVATYALGNDIIRLLALPYADHPDYRQEWKP